MLLSIRVYVKHDKCTDLYINKINIESMRDRVFGFGNKYKYDYTHER